MPLFLPERWWLCGEATPRVEPSRAQRSHLQRISYRCRLCMHASSHDIKDNALNGQADHMGPRLLPCGMQPTTTSIHPPVNHTHHTWDRAILHLYDDDCVITSCQKRSLRWDTHLRQLNLERNRENLRPGCSGRLIVPAVSVIGYEPLLVAGNQNHG